MNPTLMLALALFGAGGGAASRQQPRNLPLVQPPTLLIGIGDSLTHGTMDAANNRLNTRNSYFERLATALEDSERLLFNQPYFDFRQQRINPLILPTNLAVDGADIFSIEGFDYYKRARTETNLLSSDLLGEAPLPTLLSGKYDKVIFPLNLFTGGTASTVDGAIWLLDQGARSAGLRRAIVNIWIGNNDSSGAALGFGAKRPEYLPFPLDQVLPEFSPLLATVLQLGRAAGIVSFSPYAGVALRRNLTDAADFAAQLHHLLDRFEQEVNNPDLQVDYLLCTLPYYSSVGYLFDSDDLEYYLRKIDPGYTVPPTFARVAPPGAPITDPLLGDRVSLLTFGLMYMLLDTGYPASHVNQMLESGGVQRDGSVLSEAEQQMIRDRIDQYNAAIVSEAAARGPAVHLVDIGGLLNDGLGGSMPVIINGKPLTRKWVRGAGFSLDGVHPGYTAAALISNTMIEQLNRELGFRAPLADLDLIQTTDPYVDHDGDGWAAGPGYPASGLTDVIFLLTDSDDTDPGVGVVFPPDVWTRVSDAILDAVLSNEELQNLVQARGLGG